MELSQNGVNLIKSFEGLELHAYKPIPEEKYFTIGYGHYSPNVRADQVITEAEAEAMLKSDLATYVSGVNDLVKVKLNQNQFDALVSFSYNCGLQALKGSSLLADVNSSNFAGATQEFSKWIHGANHLILQGLVDRRKQEAALFSKPVPTGIIAQVRVIATALNIRQEPNVKSPILKVSKKGDIFNVTGNINDWHEVILDNNGNKGYAFGNNGAYLELIN